MDLTDLLGTGAAREESAPICSRKGCRAPGGFRLVWNNPKVHAPERRKEWLACPEHREYLAQFLDARGFLLEVLPLQDRPGPGPGTGGA